MRISEALGGRLPLAVQFPSGAVLNIEYTAASYTVAELEIIQKAEREPVRIIEAVRRVVLSWDLMDDDGNVVPLTPPKREPTMSQGDDGVWVEVPGTDLDVAADDPLKHIPTPVFTQILRAVNEDQSAGK